MIKVIGTLFLLIISSYSAASVVLTGTRIIFPSNKKEQSIQFTNTDNTPYLVQLSINNDNKSSEVPFIASPPIFRINPNSGQLVKLTLTDPTLPQNIESLFYLSFTQIPMLSKQERDKNKLVITVKSSVKLLYRPYQLGELTKEKVEHMSLSQRDGKLIIHNPTDYFINIKSLKKGNKLLAKSIISAPRSTTNIAIKPTTPLFAGIIELTYINDFGADQTASIKIN